MSADSFLGFRIHQVPSGIEARFDRLRLDDLTPGEVVVRVEYSTINYKDALAATGHGKILRRYPLVAGIDLAGEVVASHSPAVQVGRSVVVTGCGLSETRDGGYAQYARVDADSVIPIPDGLDAYQCMAIGTAGYTAALAIHRMEENGLRPAQGEVIVTGATGGVGSLAIDMLSARGYECAALTNKGERSGYLHALGAKRVLLLSELEYGSKPLEEARWAGAIENVGGEVLAWLTRTMKPFGTIASIGMAASTELRTTVLPFILRGVSLLGINSVYTPRPLRLAIWQRLASDLKPHHLDKIVTRTIAFEALPAAFVDYMRSSNLGRTVVRIAATQDST